MGTWVSLVPQPVPTKTCQQARLLAILLPPAPAARTAFVQGSVAGGGRSHPLLFIVCRGPGQIIGDTSLKGRPAPAAATVRARSRMRVLLVRPSDAAALVTQPSIKAALYRTQTESSVLDALETFAAYDGEVAAIDEVRRSRAASFAALNRGGLIAMGSGIPALSGAAGSGNWLATASSAGSSALESYSSVASSLASFTSAGLAAAASGSPSANQAAAFAAAAAASRSSPLPAVLCASPQAMGSFTLPARTPSRTAGGITVAAGQEPAAGIGLGLTAGGSVGGSPLRPGSRGNSFTTGSTTPRQGGLRGTSSRLGLMVQQQMECPSGMTLPSPRKQGM